MFKNFNFWEWLVELLRNDNEYSKFIAFILSILSEPLKKKLINWVESLDSDKAEGKKPQRSTKEEKSKNSGWEFSASAQVTIKKKSNKNTNKLSGIEKAKLSNNPPTLTQNHNKGDKANEKNRKKTPPKKKEKSSKKSASRKRRNHKNSRKKQ
ncbi:hypothetical protein [Streptococcus suis]|uniref:Uncharacterized protein n=1 Tax=Streptococcus suis TaxID=1307 RepID=A0A9X4MUY3_STRSU|nr:hypothetical protein [Streptococcus suis]MBY5026026.1 hypothetical protein [Streptococcus suis]MDG4527481.1 hypothetical protein [Streptococcus suis]MDG4529795.1 hypothetical protein [Streptococcus suis]QZT16372.1 hypothetical protein K6974_07080 [Streptococcus suis]